MSGQYITGIDIQNYRNIRQAKADFSPGINIFFGENGQGKTNFLEAVWLLSGGKSFRGSKDREMINFDRDSFIIEGVVRRREHDEKIRIACSKTNPRFQSRMASLSGAAFVSPSRIAGNFYRVIFSPVHLNIVSGSPALRRKFADACLCQMYPSFVENYRQYMHVIAQRNAFLKDVKKYSGRQEDIFDTFDISLSKLGYDIYRMRKEFIRQLAQAAGQYYRNISGGREKLTFVYKYCADSRQGIAEKLRRSRQRDMVLGHTGQGVHKEDIEIFLDGRPAKEYASQGQQRSIVVAMKLAESDIMQSVTGTAPAVLLDDVLSELDGLRQDYLLNHIGGRQVFITSCHLDRIAVSDSRKFLVDGGEIKQCM